MPAQGVKPIIGSEVYKAPGSRMEKSGSEKGTRHITSCSWPATSPATRTCWSLSSLGYTEGFYYKPRIDDELLEQHHEGLIALSACLAGDIPAAILNGQHGRGAEARAVLPGALRPGRLLPGGAGPRHPGAGGGEQGARRDLPGDGHPAGGHQRHPLHGAGGRARAGRADLHRHRQEGVRGQADEVRAPRVLLQVRGRDGAALRRSFPRRSPTRCGSPRCCTLELPALQPQFPVYEVPAGTTPEAYLTDLARKGLAERFSPVPPEAAKRLEYELSIITSMGFTGYFLIVWDFIHYRQGEGHRGGPGPGIGRGLPGGLQPARSPTSIPLKYGLLFERFLNPERVSMPDFDIDFCHRRRDEVIAYVTKKYGEDKVGQIITFGTLKARAVIRDVARVLDLPYDEADAIAKLVPEGPKIDLDTALKENPRLEEVAKPGAAVQGADRDQPEAGGPAPARLHARGGHRHRPGAAHRLRAAVPRPQDRRRLHPVHHGLPGGVRAHQDGLPRA